MKTISALFLGLVMSLSIVGVVYSVANDNFEASAVYAMSFACAASFMPSSEKSGVLGFLNKQYFNAGADPYTRTELGLLNHLASYGKDATKAMIQAGNIKIDTYMRVLRFKITNGVTGRIPLLDPSKGFIQGQVPEEFQNAVLQDGYNIAVSHIRTGFVADAAIVLPELGVAYATQPDGWPAALRNGQYLFSQSTLLHGPIDVEGTGTYAASTGRIEDDGLELHSPIIFAEGKQTKIELICPPTAVFGAPAGANLLELVLYGCYIRPRS